MAFCPECGKPNADQAIKCSSCGKELPQAAKSGGAKFKGTILMSSAAASKQFGVAAPAPTPVNEKPNTSEKSAAPAQSAAEMKQTNLQEAGEKIAYQATIMMSGAPQAVSPEAAEPAPVSPTTSASQVKGKGTIIAAVAPPVVLKSLAAKKTQEDNSNALPAGGDKAAPGR